MVEFLGGRGRYFSYADAVEKAGLLRGSLRGNSPQAHAAEAVLGALAVYEQAGVALALRLEGTSGCLGTLDAWHEAMAEASAELEAAERENAILRLTGSTVPIAIFNSSRLLCR